MKVRLWFKQESPESTPILTFLFFSPFRCLSFGVEGAVAVNLPSNLDREFIVISPLLLRLSLSSAISSFLVVPSLLAGYWDMHFTIAFKDEKMTNRDKIPIRLDVGQSAFNMSTLTEDQTGTFKPEVTPSVTLIPTATSDINVRISDADGAESSGRESTSISSFYFCHLTT